MYARIHVRDDETEAEAQFKSIGRLWLVAAGSSNGRLGKSSCLSEGEDRQSAANVSAERQL